MRSAIYEGVLAHRRGDPPHRFRMGVAMPLLHVDEIDSVVAAHPLWSAERPNAVSFRRHDFLGDPEQPLDEAVRDVVEERTGRRGRGPVALLAHVRTWGWLFNPLSVYFCYDQAGERVEHAVLHVTNTPWQEQHTYVLGPPGTEVVGKQLHVSPFFGMDQRYRISYEAPGDRLRLAIGVHEGRGEVFRADLHLARHELDRRSLARVLWRYPMLTTRVSLGIHTNALRLWRKGAPFRRHPFRTDDCIQREVTDAGQNDRPHRADTTA